MNIVAPLRVTVFALAIFAISAVSTTPVRAQSSNHASIRTSGRQITTQQMRQLARKAGKVSRARQALMHTQPASFTIPQGFTPKHQRLVNTLGEAAMQTFDGAQPAVGAEVIQQSADLGAHVFEAPIESTVGSATPVELAPNWGNNVITEAAPNYGSGGCGHDLPLDEFAGDGCGASCGGTCGSDYFEPACSASGCTGTCGGACDFYSSDLSCGDCGGCSVCCGAGSGPFGFGGFGGPVFNLNNASIFAGVHAHTGPSTLGSTGSFGFHEGFNIGIPFVLLPMDGVGFQVGLRTLQSNLSGADFTTSQRNQTFVTLGGFRRSTSGLQGGLVVDIMRDLWYDSIDLTQVRGEVSWKYPVKHEWGYQFAGNGSTDSAINPIDGRTDVWTANSLHRFFYRRRLNNGGRYTLSAGFSDNSDGLIGSRLVLPFSSSIEFDSSFTYLTPSETTVAGGTLNESWNMALTLVWRLGLDSRRVNAPCYRPLFDVADNGWFMVDRESR